MAKKKKQVIKVKIDPTKRKMPPEELRAFLRESRRGVGPHSTKKGKKGYSRIRDKKRKEGKIRGAY